MFSAVELRKLRSLKTPFGIQSFLDAIPYHLSPTAWSPRVVLRERTAHCLEGATFAAAALRVLNYPPLLLDLEAEQDTDHVIALFKERGHWGAVAKSNFTGSRYREPVYRTLRELVLSYFHTYFNLRGARTLRRYSRPVDLKRFDRNDWMTSNEDIWVIPNYLCDIPHRALLLPPQVAHLTPVDPRTIQGELIGHSRKPGTPLPILLRRSKRASLPSLHVKNKTAQGR